MILDEPFSGLDAINQGRLEALIRAEAADGATIIFRPMSSPMPSPCASGWRSSRVVRLRFDGAVSDARDRLRPIVRLRTRPDDGAWRAALPADGPSGRSTGASNSPRGPEGYSRGHIDAARESSFAIERPGLTTPLSLLPAVDRGGDGRTGCRHDPALICGGIRDRPPRLHRHRPVEASSFIFFLLGPLFPSFSAPVRRDRGQGGKQFRAVPGRRDRRAGATMRRLREARDALAELPGSGQLPLLQPAAPERRKPEAMLAVQRDPVVAVLEYD